MKNSRSGVANGTNSGNGSSTSDALNALTSAMLAGRGASSLIAGLNAVVENPAKLGLADRHFRLAGRARRAPQSLSL
jgi:hypothetical protein